ncbi:MAG: NAD(P)H-dependent flavin oxidoreductase [Paracoccaceae bacterium]
MPIPPALSPLKLPAIAAPMFLTSGPDLVVEACRGGVVGTFPALNARTTEALDDWLTGIRSRLAEIPGAAPFGVNLIVHKTNPRLQADLAQVIAHKVPLVITSLGAVSELVEAVHSYGGLVFHDVITRRHGEKAAEAGVDGIIAVAAGAGGHAGTLSPFAVLSELRQVFPGTLILAGAITTGADILAARAMGADMVSIGTRFIATREATVSEAQKRMIVDTAAADILYTPAISGVAANFLKPSIIANGLDPANLPDHGKLDMGSEAKVWKTVWSAGQGVGGITDIPFAADLCARLAAEYRAARTRIAADPFG